MAILKTIVFFAACVFVAACALLIIRAGGGSSGSDRVLHLRNMTATESQYRNGVQLLLDTRLGASFCGMIQNFTAEEAIALLDSSPHKAPSETPEPYWVQVGALFAPAQSPHPDDRIRATGILLEECARIKW